MTAQRNKMQTQAQLYQIFLEKARKGTKDEKEKICVNMCKLQNYNKLSKNTCVISCRVIQMLPCYQGKDSNLSPHDSIRFHSLPRSLTVPLTPGDPLTKMCFWQKKLSNTVEVTFTIRKTIRSTIYQPFNHTSMVEESLQKISRHKYYPSVFQK